MVTRYGHLLNHGPALVLQAPPPQLGSPTVTQEHGLRGPGEVIAEPNGTAVPRAKPAGDVAEVMVNHMVN